MGTLIRYPLGGTTTAQEYFGKTRQRLAPEFNRDPAKMRLLPSWTMSAGSSNAVGVSPDRKKACLVVGAISASTIDQFILFDPSDIAATWRQPVAMTATRLNACAVSNRFAVVGGASGVLHAYSFADDSVTGVIDYVGGIDSSGLGQINAIAFSQDQRYVYVSHATTPFLRRYDTTNWTFVNAVTADSSTRTAIAVLKSGHVVVCGTGSPFVSVYSANLQTRHGTTTTSVHSRTQNAAIVQDAINTHACYIPSGPGDSTAARTKMLKVTINPTTFAVTFESKTAEMTGGDDAVRQVMGWMYYDEIVERYFVFVYGDSAQDRKVRVIHPSTLALDAEWTERYTHAVAGSAHYNEIALYVPALRYYRISGTVRDINNSPAQRIVRAYRRSDGVLMAETTSDPSTGSYTLRLSDSGVYDVQFLTLDGETLNDLFYARTTPELVVL